MEIKRIELKGYRRFAFSNIDMLEAKFTSPVQVITAANGAGKYHPLTEPIKVPGGWKTMGEVEVGSMVTAWDGNPTQVIAVHQQGMQDVYKLTVADNRHSLAGGPHLWPVYIVVGGIVSYQIKTTSEIEALLPYANVYLALACGGDTVGNPKAYRTDTEEYKDDSEEIGRSLVTGYEYPIYRESNKVTDNYLKFFNRYMFEKLMYRNDASRSAALNAMSECMQKDGLLYYTANHDRVFTHPDKLTATYIAHLMHSLGLVAHIEKIDGKYRISSSDLDGTNDICLKNHGLPYAIRITSIEKLPEQQECACITIAHPSQLYLTRGFLVTHNSSLLRELCPLPATRTDYSKGGYRVMDIGHDGHDYTLTSDFNNKTSPHSFIMDGDELNVSGNSSVQSELVIKHFGITPAIRDLIYGKTKLCSSSPSDRKSLFLSTNPMDLSLILDTHKKTLSKLRFYKDNLQHLYTRKVDLEGQMIDDELLKTHNETKAKYMSQVKALDKLVTILEQHISRIRSEYGDTLRMQDNRTDSLVVPSDEYLNEKITRWAGVPKHYGAALDLYHPMEALDQRMHTEHEHIKRLISEINDYSKYIEKSDSRPLDRVETEMQDLREAMSKYEDLPDIPVPISMWDAHRANLDKINHVLFIFRDIPGTLLSMDDVEKLKEHCDILVREIAQIGRDIANVSSTLAQYKEDLNDLKDRTGIPTGCQFDECRLAMLARNRLKKIHTDIEVKTKEYAELTAQLAKLEVDHKIAIEQYQPYEDHRILARYRLLLSALTDSYFSHLDKWEDTLLHRLRTQPLRIYAQLEDYLIKCKDGYAYQELKVKYDKLQIELKHMQENTGGSVEFLKSVIADKEVELAKHTETHTRYEHKRRILDTRYTIMKEYDDEIFKVNTAVNLLEHKENSEMAKASLEYFESLLNDCIVAKKSIEDDLHDLSVLVKHQDTIRATYTTEILSSIDKYEKERSIYSKVEMALSPTTGLPHKSMVRYLNTMIHNVNSFISRIWAYKLRLMELDESKPIDYHFKVMVGSETVKDIGGLSDGQQEVVNFAWVLTILLQLKMLDKVPLFADELGRTFDGTHRNRVFAFIGSMIDSGVISQMFLVNHFAVYTDGFRESEVMCLSREDAKTLPGNVNEHVTITSL